LRGDDITVKNLIKRVVLVAVVFQLAGLVIVFSESTAATITTKDIYSDYINKAYVVEGVIQSPKLKWILHEEYNPYTTHPALLGKKTQIVEIEFTIENVLIGDLEKKYVTLIGLGGRLYSGGKTRDLSELETGDKIIIPLRYIPKGMYESGEKLFITGCDNSRFLIKGDTFIRGRKSEPIQTGKVADLYKAIEEIKKMRSIEAITEKAELIVQGKVKNRWTTEDTLSNGLSKHIERVELEIESLFKGNLNNNTVVFSIIIMASYNPPWKTSVPIHINPGEDWIVFLKWAEEPGYYPFAGVNGMFRLKGDKAIRDNRKPVDNSLKAIKAAISRGISGGDKNAE